MIFTQIDYWIEQTTNKREFQNELSEVVYQRIYTIHSFEAHIVTIYFDNSQINVWYVQSMLFLSMVKEEKEHACRN